MPGTTPWLVLRGVDAPRDRFGGDSFGRGYGFGVKLAQQGPLIVE